jgi:hypothetical protein
MALSQVVPVTVDESLPYGNLYDAAGNLITVLGQATGLALPEVITLDANSRLVPVGSRSVAVAAPAGASTGKLAFVSAGAVPAGLVIEIETADPTRPIFATHAADPTTITDPVVAADALPVMLSDAQNPGDYAVLDTIYKRLRLRHDGTAFTEVGRDGFPDVSSTIGSAPQDFGGYAVAGMSLSYVPKTMPYTLVRSEVIGRGLQATNAGTLLLPNPAGGGWLEGDAVLWETLATDLIFRQWDGNPPTSALGHDRAFAQWAEGWVRVARNAPGGPLGWRLTGCTKGPPSVVGTVRTYALSTPGPDYPVPNDTAWHQAGSGGTLTHAYGAGESWLYLATFGFLGLGTTANNSALTRFVQNLGSDVEVGHAGRPRWSTGVGRYGFVTAATYGGTAGSATYRIDVANAATGFALTVQAPTILGLRLETGEGFHPDLGPHSDAAGTWTDVNSWTFTTGADDFGLIAAMEWGASSAAVFADVQLLVDGTGVFPVTTMGRDGPGAGSWTTAWPVTLAAGSHVFKLQIRLTPGATGTVTGKNSTLALLKKGAFQKWNADSSGAASSYSSGTYTAKLSDAWTLQAGYKTLVIGTAQAFSPNASAAAEAKVRFRRNAALLEPEAIAGVRNDNSFEASSVMYVGVLDPQLTTDAFDIGGASADGASAVKIQGAALIAAALA